MSKKGLNEALKALATDKELNRQVEGAIRELHAQQAQAAKRVLSKYDLTAGERAAILDKDHLQLTALGVDIEILKRADWCTGD